MPQKGALGPPARQQWRVGPRDKSFRIAGIPFTTWTLVASPHHQTSSLSQLCARTAGPGQQVGAPFFSQSPTIPGSEPRCCRKGKGLQCMKGREEEKRRCKCACACVLGEMETSGKNRPAFRVWLTPSPASYSAYVGSHDLSSSPSHAIVCLTCLNKRCYFKRGQLSIAAGPYLSCSLSPVLLPPLSCCFSFPSQPTFLYTAGLIHQTEWGGGGGAISPHSSEH